MSMETALIAFAQSQRTLTGLQRIEFAEWDKGCRPDILPVPVALEPHFQPMNNVVDLLGGSVRPHEVIEPPPRDADILRSAIYIASEYSFDWHRCELFLKLLSAARRRMGFEIVGNRERIYLAILYHRDAQSIVATAFRSEMGTCELGPLEHDLLADAVINGWPDIVFHDYYPPPPYVQSLTCMDELRRSPYEPILHALAAIEPPAVGVYQMLFQPVAHGHNWHRNMRAIQTVEYVRRQVEIGPTIHRYAQQSPAGSLLEMARELKDKAHNDRPILAAALRTAVIGAGERAHELLPAVSMVAALFQHGGQGLNRLTEADYARVIDVAGARSMFIHGLTHRPGFLLNSEELTGLVHIPPIATMNEVRPIPVRLVRSLSMPLESLSTGTPIGYCEYAGGRHPVCIPDSFHRRHVHMVGKPDMGKSTVLENAILHDIRSGQGVGVIDPHGDLIRRILPLIPEDCVERTIYLDPGDPGYVPIWNPMSTAADSDLTHVASNLVGAFRGFIDDWGQRLEHLLGSAILALLHRPGSTLLDVSNLLQTECSEGKQLRSELLSVVTDQLLHRFLQHDLLQYSKRDRSPAQHKLSLLLFGTTLSRMLRQPDSRFTLRQVMDDRMILLVDLSHVDGTRRNVFGSLMLGLLHSTALSRSDTASDERNPFSMYVDEAHRFLTEAMEDLIAETRKFGVSLTLAHQYLSQFKPDKVDALASTGSTLIFNVNTRGAELLTRELRGKVSVNDLISLEKYEAILRCGTDIVRIRTNPPAPIPANTCRDQIIRESRRRYYEPVGQPTGSEPIASRPRSGPPFAETQHAVEDFTYDEGF